MIGDAEVPLIAVITPYWGETYRQIARCHRSVLGQRNVRMIHILVGDGPDTMALDFPGAINDRLSVPARDYGETPRLRGWQIALDLGADAIAYLDADNWFLPDHVASLAAAATRVDAEVAVSRRMLYHVNGQAMARCGQSDGDGFADTNCLLFTMPRAARWMDVIAKIPPALKPIHDRVLWHAIRKSDARIAMTHRHSVAYVSRVAGHYRALGLAVPPGLEGRGAAIRTACQHWADAGNPPFDLSHRLSVPGSLPSDIQTGHASPPAANGTK